LFVLFGCVFGSFTEKINVYLILLIKLKAIRQPLISRFQRNNGTQKRRLGNKKPWLLVVFFGNNLNLPQFEKSKQKKGSPVGIPRPFETATALPLSSPPLPRIPMKSIFLQRFKGRRVALFTFVGPDLVPYFCLRIRSVSSRETFLPDLFARPPSNSFCFSR